MKTRAAVVVEPGEPLRLEEVELAAPGAGEVRVRMEACGICRSDLHAIDGGEDVRFPAVLGHEGCGTVEEVGPGVARLAVGRRVVLSWTPACGECPACLRREVHLCHQLTMSAAGKGPLTWAGRSLDRFMALGAFCERVVVPEAMAVPIHGEIPARLACLLGCAVMTGFGAAANAAAVRWGERVAVFGCGGVGLAAIQGARIAGAGYVVAIDPVAERRRSALQVGASEAVPPGEAGERLHEITGGEGVDAAIECVGSPAVVVDAFRAIRPGGRAVAVGLPRLRDRIELPALPLLADRTLRGSIYGSSNPAVDFPRLVALHDRGRLDLAALVGSVRPLAEVNEGIAETRQAKVPRVVLTFP